MHASYNTTDYRQESYEDCYQQSSVLIHYNRHLQQHGIHILVILKLSILVRNNEQFLTFPCYIHHMIHDRTFNN